MNHLPPEEKIRREARERLNPSLTNPNWLILGARREIFQRWIGALDGRELRILDVGGRIQPYRKLFDGRVSEYHSLDLAKGPFVSVVGNAERLPLAPECFDVVLCTQMLEYAPRPQQVIDEIRRVLRPGGHLLLSVPSIFPRDSDPEYWRFLRSSLQLLLREFSNVEIAAEGSTISGFFRTLNVSLITFAPRALRSVLCYTAVPALNLAAAAFEAMVRTSNDQLTANFSALARK